MQRGLMMVLETILPKGTSRALPKEETDGAPSRVLREEKWRGDTEGIVVGACDGLAEGDFESASEGG